MMLLIYIYILNKRFLVASFAILLGFGLFSLINLFNISSVLAEDVNYSISINPSLSIKTTPSNISMLLNPASHDFDTKDLNITVGTNYINGYKLYISSPSTSLTNDDYNVGANGSNYYINTLSSTTSETDFPANYWGYRVSNINSSSNNAVGNSSITDTTGTYFYPFVSNNLIASSPTATVGSDITTLTFGTKINYDSPSGTYINTFNLTAVINPVTYSITYADNTGDTITDLPTPNPENGIIAGTIIPVSSTIPKRTGYTFKSWCKGTVSSNGTICTGTEYTAGSSINIETANIVDTTFTLNAVWTINQYTCTKQYRLQNANGTWESYTTDTTEQVNFGDTCSYSKTMANYKGSDDGPNGSATTTSGTMTENGITLQVSMYRNTNTVSLTKGTGISNVTVTGAGVKSGSGSASVTVYCEGAVTINATMASTYTWVNWTGSATYSNRSQSISNVTGNLSFTANGRATTFNDAYGTTGTKYMQNMTSSICAAVNNGQTTTLRDSRDNKDYTVAKINGTCWMTQNLRLGYNSSNPNTTSISVNSSNTNINTTKTLTAYDLEVYYNNGQYCYGTYDESNYTGTGNGYSYPCMHSGVDNKGNPTVWYNYAATTAGTITGTSNTTDASYSLCPKGWRLPTYNDNINVVNYVSLFNPVYGGYYGWGAVTATSTNAYWWSSQTSSNMPAGRLRMSYEGDTLYYSSWRWRYYGFYIRCVAQ